MKEEGYENVLKNNVQETETTCASCGCVGKMKVVDLGDVTENMICAFVCGKCGDRSVNFFDKMCDKRGSIRIECSFDCPEDLHREVNLNQLASVKVTSADFSFEFSSAVPGVYNVESLLRQAEDQMKNLCGKEDITSGAGGNVLGNANVSKEVCEKKLKDVQSLIANPKFEMVIEDDFGLSRVAPVGKSVSELQNSDVHELDDKKVKHLFKKRAE